jgi:hypothetical protein
VFVSRRSRCAGPLRRVWVSLRFFIGLRSQRGGMPRTDSSLHQRGRSAGGTPSLRPSNPKPNVPGESFCGRGIVCCACAEPPLGKGRRTSSLCPPSLILCVVETACSASHRFTPSSDSCILNRNFGVILMSLNS